MVSGEKNTPLKRKAALKESVSPKIYVAIVSHNNETDIISTLKPHLWSRPDGNIQTTILTNLPSPKLTRYCNEHAITLLTNTRRRGFGENNNIIYRHLGNKTNHQDYFFCINPDIQVTKHALIELANTMAHHKIRIAAPNLVTSDGQPDDNIRAFPRLTDCASRLVSASNASTIDKSYISQPTEIDWASGAFLCFCATTFEELDGFDESYFMYYEDADICFRAKKLGIKTIYVPGIQAKHKGARKSRKIFSKLGYNHIKSALRFLYRKSKKN